MFPAEIHTERLRLRRLSRELLDPIDVYEYFAATETIAEETEHLSWDPHATPKETRDFLADSEESWEEAETAGYAIYPAAGEDGAGEFAGTAALSLDWDKRLAYFGIWLRKPFWGRGYSGERAAAFMRLAFERLDLELITVGHLDGNEKSKRAISKYTERFGGRYEGVLRNDVVIDGEPRDLHRYTVSQTEWHDAVTEGDAATVEFVESSGGECHESAETEGRA